MRRLIVSLLMTVTSCDQAQVGPTPSGPEPEVPIETSQDTLSLVAIGDTTDDLVTELHYQRRIDQVAPRMMELWVEVGDGLAFTRSEPLEAARSAGKDVLVQKHGTSLRVIVFASDNTATLESGRLARLVFTRSGGSDLTLTLSPRLPIFAPAAANDGLLLGAPLNLAGARP